jgi:two-component system response regulator FixJ
MPETHTVYVIDDDSAARDSLEFLLTAHGLAVRAFETAESFISALPKGSEGCVVTDVRMPGMTGIQLLRELKNQSFAMPVIVITGHGDIPLAVEAMREGAADFLEKPYDEEALLKSISRSLEAARSGAAAENTKADIVQRISSLSGRESEVMAGLVAGKSNKVIAIELNISPRTVEIYRANVMSKMDADSLPALVRMAIEAGFPDQPAKG